MRGTARIVAIAGFFLLVSLPLLVQLAGIDHDEGGGEHRVLAPAPRWPMRLADLAALQPATAAWLDDHFGLRRALVRLDNHLRFTVFAESGNPQIAFGRHRQLFLTSHDAVDPQQILWFLCRGGASDTENRSRAHALAGFLDAAIRRSPHVVDLLVPTKTIIEQIDLPGWMRARCAGGREALPALLSALATERPDLGTHVFYPLTLMQDLNRTDAPYPRFNFHWDGPALGVVAAAVAEHRFGRRRLATLPLQTLGKVSDITHLLPGAPMPFRVAEPDLAAAGIASSPRIAELGATGAILYDVSRFTRHDRPTAGREPRLLILSDSFGQAIAPWFAAYYGEVWHVAVNNIAQLAPDRQTELTGRLFDRFEPDDVLLVFHDFSQAYINQQLMRPLWHQGPPAR